MHEKKSVVIIMNINVNTKKNVLASELFSFPSLHQSQHFEQKVRFPWPNIMDKGGVTNINARCCVSQAL